MGTILYSELMNLCWFRKWVLACLLFGVGGNIYAQKVQLGGIVQDAITDEVVPLVGVMLQNTNFGVNTNLDGEYLMIIPAGDYLLTVRSSGYLTFQDSIHLEHDSLSFNIILEPVTLGLDDVVITSNAVNPAHRVIRNAIARRRQNRFDKIDSYEYEAYNKLVITMDNVTDQFLNRKLIRGVGKQVQQILGDSTHSDSSKYKLAVFVSESVSKFYYQRPDQKKEEIIAVQTSGVKGSEYNLLSSMFLQLDMYNNNVVIVNRTFLSPIAEGAFLDYDYQLINAEIYGRDTLFGIEILPKRPYDPVFKGLIYIDNKDWAINRLDLELNENPNINFVEDIRIRQAYAKVDSF
ncbi:MAG TPA: carboxypeptidase-like regulatory domain-containing protein, partial [Bacteroidetes bacterium]|nr:carboxypeptidase-like regulatory domain-containing protein [Bacteroidota bacterium]